VTHDGTDTDRFWQHIEREELPYHRCEKCGRPDHPPLSSCRHCGAAISAWQVSRGRGTIRTWTLVERSGDSAFREMLPFATAIVEMDEGFLLLAGIDPPDQVDIGERCRLTFRISPATGRTLPHFRAER